MLNFNSQQAQAGWSVVKDAGNCRRAPGCPSNSKGYGCRSDIKITGLYEVYRLEVAY